jgi:hypothetical protein
MSYEIRLYPNNLKNWKFDKKAPQNFCLERMTIAERQGMSEDKILRLSRRRQKPIFQAVWVYTQESSRIGKKLELASVL